MTNKEIYEIMDKLGMIEEVNSKCCDTDGPIKSEAEIFDEYTSKDLVYTMNFVEELALYNDLETIKKLLVAIIYQNNEK